MKMRDMVEALETASFMEARGHDDSPAWTPGQAKQAQRAAAKLAEAIRFMESGLKALKRTQVLDDAHGNILDAIHGLKGAARHLKAAPFEKTRPGGAVVASSEGLAKEASELPMRLEATANSVWQTESDVRGLTGDLQSELDLLKGSHDKLQAEMKRQKAQT